MAKKKVRVESAATALATDGVVPVVGMREPCPCGSGRRYKACHGKVDEVIETTRPFEGFASECDLVALRELVPSATAPLTLRSDAVSASGKPAGMRTVTLATVLPMAYPAIVRMDGEILLGLQVNTSSGNASRDLARVLAAALDTEPGTPVDVPREAANSIRLQDLIDGSVPLDVTVHSGFDFWSDVKDMDEETRASLDRASEYAHPTVRLNSVEAAYWCQMGEKEHLRWAMPVAEEALLNAVARLDAASESALGEGTKLVGMFRAHGIVVPVWDLPLGFGASACEAPAAEFLSRLNIALADSTPLTDAQRRARSLLTTRQVTLR